MTDRKTYYAIQQQGTVLDWTIRATEADCLDALLRGSTFNEDGKTSPFYWWERFKRDLGGEVVKLDLAPTP